MLIKQRVYKSITDIHTSTVEINYKIPTSQQGHILTLGYAIEQKPSKSIKDVTFAKENGETIKNRIMRKYEKELDEFIRGFPGELIISGNRLHWTSNEHQFQTTIPKILNKLATLTQKCERTLQQQ